MFQKGLRAGRSGLLLLRDGRRTIEPLGSSARGIQSRYQKAKAGEAIFTNWEIAAERIRKLGWCGCLKCAEDVKDTDQVNDEVEGNVQIELILRFLKRKPGVVEFEPAVFVLLFTELAKNLA